MTAMNIKRWLQALGASVALCAVHAHAGIVVAGTRVVFPANEREVTIKITNEGAAPALVQAWVDSGGQNESPTHIDVPFTLTPPLFRLDAGKGQTLRMMQTGEPMPTDKESLYWLNVLEVPPKAAGDDTNKIQLAFRTRIKVMYRPEGLAGSATEARDKLSWVFKQTAPGKYALVATNPTPYVVNVGSISLKSDGKTYDAGAGYVLPGSHHAFPISSVDSALGPDAVVLFSAIDDWGSSTQVERAVSVKP